MVDWQCSVTVPKKKNKKREREKKRKKKIFWSAFNKNQKRDQ